MDISWDVEIFGNTISGNATEVDISNQPIEDAKALAAMFPYWQVLLHTHGFQTAASAVAFWQLGR